LADQDSSFNVGLHRPVYLWAGPGTVRMNKLKFMGAPNDEFVHTEAHTPIGAARISYEAGFNWAYLMFDWGFPPEIAQEDWQDFNKAVSIYHNEGVKVFGYLQFSNCVFQGSFKNKEWYALDPQGRSIYYYTGRFMTCLLHPGWLQHLRDRITAIIEAKADGVFFDNPWFGIQPIHFGGTWSGPAGCYCPSCQKAFYSETGLSIPQDIHPETDENSRTYLAWRAGVVTQTIKSLANFARDLHPGIVISVNDYDAIMHPTYISHGIDLPHLAACQDIVMIEDFALPRFQPDVLINNAITIRSALAMVGDVPVTTDPYDKGIGFDKVYPPRRIQQGIAEAAACGTAMVVKGTEYVNKNGIFTLLTAKEYAPQRFAVGQLYHWLAENSRWYQNRQNIARIGLLYPAERMKTHWDETASLFFALCQVLTINGYPWRVANPGSAMETLECIFHFEPIPIRLPGVKTIYVPGLAGWHYSHHPFLAKHSKIRLVVSNGLAWFYRAYFQYRWARRLMDGLGLPQWFLGSPHFKIPEEDSQRAILNTLDGVNDIRVKGERAPVLIEHWQQHDQKQIHLVNYAATAQTLTLYFPYLAEGSIIPFQGQTRAISGKTINFELDIYAFITYLSQDQP
jgi:hypothetical protein